MFFGVSGRKLLSKLVEQGYVDPKDVQETIHFKLMPKAQQISDSLFGTLNTHQIFLIRQSWNHIIFLEEQLEQLEKQIEELLIPYKQQVELLLTIPGVKKSSVASIIAEIGIEMSQFPSAQHLASWAGLAPGNYESAGKKKHPNNERKSTHKIDIMCSGVGNFKDKKTWLASKYWSLAARKGKKKALIAIAHKTLKIIYHILAGKQPFIEYSKLLA